MSTTVDSRVVEMRFDNKHFEQNVSTTLSTLEKLKRSLNLDGATKGLESVDRAARSVDMMPLGDAVQTVQNRFSALQVMAVTALANITNSAVNTGKRMVSALTIDPIKTGFSEYETQINAVQTILANTSNKGTTLNDVNKALDTLNTYADKTIYNFTEMTRNIGTFTAAGVDLDTSVRSIQGIANLAAISGSTSQQASTAMYQLSQALAAGKVNLMDWNSVVNAGMGGQVFQDALKRTATVMGTNVDAMIEKYGSFRESLARGGWLTSDVLTKTLEQFTMAAEEGTEQWEKYKASLMEEGYTEAQANEILKMANTATDAATKVKTFTQLWDTLKEAAQSGWTQTWEIIVGDFEEAKLLLTEISDVIGSLLNESARARNEVLQGWKDLGGRKDLIESFRNVFESIASVVKPIGDAFRAIFPPITAQQLYNFTEGLKNLTEKLKLTKEESEDLKTTFKGVFAIVDIFVTVLKKVGGGAVKLLGGMSGLRGGILEITAALGQALINFSEFISGSKTIEKTMAGVGAVVSGAGSSMKSFGTAIKEAFLHLKDIGVLQTVLDILKQIATEAGKVVSSLMDGIAAAFSGGSGLDDLINGGLLAGILLAVRKFTNNLSAPFKGLNGIFENVKGVLEDVRGTFEAYQNSLNAKTLMEIAKAIGLLTVSIVVLSAIDGDKLTKSLAAVGALFGELLASLAIFSKISVSGIGSVIKAVPLMISMSSAILLLSFALKNIASVDAGGIAKSLVAIGVLMAELSLFLNYAQFDGKIGRASTGILILSSAMIVLSKAVQNFGSMSAGEITKGLVSIGALLAGLAIFTNTTGNAQHVMATGTSMILLASAMKILASAMTDFSSMSWDEIGRGLTAMGGGLAVLAGVIRILPKNMASMGAGILVVGAAMKILASAMTDFGGMSWSEIGRGLTIMGGSLAILAGGLFAMRGSMSGSTALLVAAGALSIFAPVMVKLGDMSWGEIGKGLIAIAGAFTILGVAGYVLGPVVPVITSLAGSLALIGVAALGFGVAIGALSAAFATLATAGTAGATAIVAALHIIVVGIVDLIPTIISKLGEAITALCTLIGEFAPQIAESALKLISEVVKALATYTPQIVDGLMTFLIGLLNGVADRMPELIVAAVNLLGSFFKGLSEALGTFDTATLLKAVAGLGLLTGLMWALSSVTAVIPGAMAGVLGLGVVVAELAIVLAAIGALSKIPGLSWLIGEGGDFLEKIGTAIGQFVGGIVGGIAQGVTSSLPQIGADLSNFMKSLQPFIDGAKGLDASMMEGVKSLATAILTLTAADVISGLTSWFTGGSSMADFAEQLVPLGTAMKRYSEEVAGIDTAAVTTSVTAAKALVKVAESIPNSGGVAGFFAGDNSLGDFAGELTKFGKGMKQYSDAVVGIDIAAVNNSVTAAKSIMGLINSMSVLNTQGVASFKMALSSLATVSIDGFIQAFSSATPSLNAVGSNMVNAITQGAASKTASLLGTATQLMTSFVTGITSKKRAVETAFQNVVDSATKKKASYYDGAYRVGSYIVDGLAAGISDNSYKAEAKAAAMASAALQAAREELDINSPSGEFEEVGMYADQGLAKGIDENANVVTESATNLGSDMIDSVGEGITKSKSAEEAMTAKVGSIIGSFKAAIENAQLDMTTADLEYKLWSVTSGVGASDSEKMSAELKMLESKIASQQSIVAVKQREYDNAIAKFGKDANATQKAYNALMEAKIALGELQVKMNGLQKEVTVNQRNAFWEYTQLIKNEADGLLELGLTAEEIDGWAKAKSGYSGHIFYNPVAETAEKVDETVQEVKETVEVVKEVVDTAAEEIKESGVVCAEAMAEGMAQGVESVEEVAAEVADACTEEVKYKKKAWHDGGTVLVENFAEGIKDNIVTAVEAATEMAKAAVSAVNEVFNPESVDIGGMSDVITNLDQSVANSTGVAGSVSPVLNSGDGAPTMAFIDGVITRLASDLNMNSTELANRLVNAVDSGNAHIVDAINNMSGKEYFQEMVAAINGLKSDISALGSRIGSMSVKMDSGALVGEIKAKMDNALGQISTHKGRGN